MCTFEYMNTPPPTLVRITDIPLYYIRSRIRLCYICSVQIQVLRIKTGNILIEAVFISSNCRIFYICVRGMQH